MPLPGGSADKIGNRYEGRWTVSCLALVMADKAVAIELEPPDGEGIEFRLHRRDGAIEHHQVKLHAPDSGSWTLGALRRSGVLKAMQKRTGVGLEFVFVSSSPVGDDLPDLTAQARAADDESQFLGLLGAKVAQLARARSEWPDLELRDIWAILRGTFFRQIDELTAFERASDRLALLVDGDPTVATRLLADYAVECVNQRLTSSRLWAFLATTPCRRRDWGQDPLVRTAVDKQCRRYLADIGTASIRGHRFARSESEDIVQLLTAADGARRVLVSAPAGLGKSVVVGQAVQSLTDRGVVTLPMRLDQLEAALRPEALGAQLGLPGSPAYVLASLAGDEPAVLVIDQLDAVSQVSGRNAPMLDCVEEVLREAAAFPSVRVLLASRGFDLEADPRLRRLRTADGTQVIEVGPLADDQVDEVLREIGWTPSALTEKQRNLLRSPLHLRLLADAPRADPAFGSEVDLYEAFWDAKRDALRARVGDDSSWSDVIDAVCESMNARQSLSAPVDAVDRWRQPVGALLSEVVLIKQDRRIRFFHEGFFDFAFAKRFSVRGASLVEFLRSTDQGLFHRSQTRQILNYRRLADRDLFQRDLREVLSAPDIRFHLKTLVCAWLGTLDDPIATEWDVLRDLVDAADGIGAQVVSLLASSPGWFDRADERGDVAGWLTSDDDVIVDRGVWIVAAIQRHRAARAAELLRSLPRGGDRWRRRYEFVTRRADLTLDEGFLTVILELVDCGCLDELKTPFAANDTFWGLAHGLSEKHPAWAARFARAFLERRSFLAQEAGAANPFSADWIPDQLDRDLFVRIAKAAPEAFVAELLPFMVAVVDRTKHWNDEEQRYDDPVWAFRSVGQGWGVRDGLMAGMEMSLAAMAGTAVPSFELVRPQLIEAQSETFDFLLVRAFAAAPERYAAEAAEFILDNRHRLETGYTGDGHWAARELLAAIYPHVSPEMRQRLEAVLLAYYPRWERSPAGHRGYGSSQRALLSGIPIELLSVDGRRRLAELRRKFPDEPEAPRETKAEWVGPPIREDAAGKLTDAQWLRAFETYHDDTVRWRRPLHLAGGVHELAGLLRRATKADPLRYAKLAIRIPDSANAAYFEAILGGLDEASDVPAEVVFSVCHRCHAVPGRPCGRNICDPIAKHATSVTLPDDIADLVAWYAVEDPDPERGGGSVPGPDEEDREGLGLLNLGINTNRGRAASAMRPLLAAQPELLARWGRALERLADDPSLPVRACAAEAILAVLRHDRDRAVDLFVRLSAGHPEVVASPAGEAFVRYATITHPDEMAPIIESLLEGPRDYERRAGGRLACLAGFSSVWGQSASNRAMAGSDSSRLGAAEVYAANLDEPALRDTCDAALRKLFVDPSADVRQEAATCFRSLDGGQLGELRELLEAFAASPAIADNPRDAIDALLKTTATLPDVTGLVCSKVIDLAGVEAGSIASAWAAEMPDLAALAVRLHSFGSQEGRQVALDLIDKLCAVGAYGLDTALLTFDR